jgi:hypothetical protein
VRVASIPGLTGEPDTVALESVARTSERDARVLPSFTASLRNAGQTAPSMSRPQLKMVRLPTALRGHALRHKVRSYRDGNTTRDEEWRESGLAALPTGSFARQRFPYFSYDHLHSRRSLSTARATMRISCCLERIRTWAEPQPSHHRTCVWPEIEHAEGSPMLRIVSSVAQATQPGELTFDPRSTHEAGDVDESGMRYLAEVVRNLVR